MRTNGMRPRERGSRRERLVWTGVWLALSGGWLVHPAAAQSAVTRQPAGEAAFDPQPQTRMRPIGEASLVDQYRSADRPASRETSSREAASRETAGREPAGREPAARLQETGAWQTVPSERPAETVRFANREANLEVPSLQQSGVSSGVRRTVFQAPNPQAPNDQTPNAAPALPADPSGEGSMGMPGASRPLPGTSAGGSGLSPVPTRPVPTRPLGGGAGSDGAAVPVPRIGQPMATLDNCANISAPSPYTAGGYWGCDPVPATYSQPAAFVPPPATVAPPLAMPGSAPYIPNNAGYRPLFTLGQDTYNAQLGRGIIGQPTAYVPGQPMRNFLRYLSP